MPQVMLLLFLLLLQTYFSTVLGIISVFPTCTGNLRVCDDGEDPYHYNNLKLTQFCIPNQLERKTVFLTGAAWESAKYNLWIATIILSEIMQVPVKIVNVNGGSTEFYYYDNEKLDALDGRVYSWDALHIASTETMDCHPSYLDHFVKVPEDLRAVDCVENCKPCAHAMLEVWPSGQKGSLNQYAAELRTIEYGGNLGVVGEVGWWATKQALEKDPLLSSYRGLRDPSVTNLFREPVPFGPYCNATYDEWSWVVSSLSPSALDVTIPSHFCHFFFDFAVNLEYGVSYSRNDPTYLPTRREQVNRCASLIDGTGILFYDLCKRYWIVPSDIYKALPSVGTDLFRKGYGPYQFLYRGYFRPSSQGGILQTAGCPSDAIMPVSRSYPAFNSWDNATYGEQGYIRWKNYDRDIVSSHGLAIKPKNMPNDIPDVLELSARLMQTHPNDSAPVLFNSYRPSPLFRRHLYDRADEDWGGFMGEEFELSKVQLPEYHESCEKHRRSFHDRCSTDTLSTILSGEVKQCGYDQEILYKLFSSKLQQYSPEAYYLLRRFEMTTNQQEHLMAAYEYDTEYRKLNPATRARTIACDWVKNNTESWKGWLPSTAAKRRCLGEIGNPLLQGTTIVECSGHGTCEPHSQTEYNFVNAGECKCQAGYQGDDCSGLVVPTLINVSYTHIEFYVVLGLASVTFLQTLRYWHMVRDNPQSVVFKVSNRLFIYMNLSSVILGLIGIFLWVGENTIWHCTLRPILLGFPYVLSISSMFVKVFRKKIKRAVNNEDLIELVRFVCAVVLALFLVWMLIFSPTPRDIRLDDKVWFKYSACIYGENLSAFVALLFVFSSLLSVVTIYLAWDIRWMTSYFRETEDLIRTSTFLFVNAIIGLVLASWFTSPKETEKFICISSTILCNCWVILWCLIRPKIYVHVKKPEMNNMRDGLHRPRGEGDDVVFGLKPATRKKLSSTLAKFSPLKYCRKRRSGKVSYQQDDGMEGNQDNNPDNPTAKVSNRKLVKSPSRPSAMVKKSTRAIAITKQPSKLASRGTITVGEPVAQAFDDPNKVGVSELGYRSPEMIVLMEKKYRQAVEVNKQLMTILEEHHIDPETGDMDDDYHQVIHAMEEKQLEEIAMMDELYQQEMEMLEEEMQEEKIAMRQKLRDIKQEMNNRHKDAMAKVKHEAKERTEKLKEIQVETNKLKDALEEALPSISEFLHSKGLEQYIAAFQEAGVQSFHEVLLMDESEFIDLEMKTGHIRKLQTALKVYQPAAKPKKFPGSPVRTKGLTGDATEGKKGTQVLSNTWKSAIDNKSGKRYWYNKALNKSVWKKPKEFVEQNEGDVVGNEADDNITLEAPTMVDEHCNTQPLTEQADGSTGDAISDLEDIPVTSIVDEVPEKKA